MTSIKFRIKFFKEIKIGRKFHHYWGCAVYEFEAGLIPVNVGKAGEAHYQIP
ncbi:hypothetical protein P408_12620 [Brucella abortus S99]|nr:hypothetical protein P408_12620 [Brucella abortus S99]